MYDFSMFSSTQHLLPSFGLRFCFLLFCTWCHFQSSSRSLWVGSLSLFIIKCWTRLDFLDKQVEWGHLGGLWYPRSPIKHLSKICQPSTSPMRASFELATRLRSQGHLLPLHCRRPPPTIPSQVPSSDISMSSIGSLRNKAPDQDGAPWSANAIERKRSITTKKFTTNLPVPNSEKNVPISLLLYGF